MPTPAFRTGPRAPVAALGLAALLALSTAASGGTANIEPSADKSSIYRRDTGIDDSGRYQREVQACRTGRSAQARETCLQEARNAMAARRQGELSKQNEDFTANAMERCRPLTGEFRAACQARVMGFGSTSGSVAGGGLLRQVETVVLPAGATSIRIEPQTERPVVLVQSAPATGQAAAAGGTSQGAAQQQALQASPNVIAVRPVDTESMAQLREAAQRLRESIQAMAQKQPGPDRDRAIAQAHDALLETQRAMVALPPELRSSGTVSTAGYDESVRKLMQAADSLRESIQAMAQQPAGDGRNRAIDQARQALWDSQQAMLSAYGAGATDSRRMGAGR